MSEQTCPFCGEPILPGQPTVIDDGDRLHIGCSIDLADGVTLDSEMHDD